MSQSLWIKIIWVCRTSKTNARGIIIKNIKIITRGVIRKRKRSLEVVGNLNWRGWEVVVRNYFAIKTKIRRINIKRKLV